MAERISEHRGIVAFRNQLVHAYEKVQDPVTWRIIGEKLPVLLAEVEALLADAEPID